jgi:hypothetical protein
MRNKALIAEVSGQDRAYLAEYLLKKNYTVVCCNRRSSSNDGQRLDVLSIKEKIISKVLDIIEINKEKKRPNWNLKVNLKNLAKAMLDYNIRKTSRQRLEH